MRPQASTGCREILGGRLSASCLWDFSTHTPGQRQGWLSFCRRNLDLQRRDLPSWGPVAARIRASDRSWSPRWRCHPHVRAKHLAALLVPTSKSGEDP